MNYDMLCEMCDEEWIRSCKYEERDDGKGKCPECGALKSKRVFRQFPGVTNASYVDGTKSKGPLLF